MTQIIKVILKNGTSIHSDFFIDELKDSRFQREILTNLDNWDIKDYAKDYLDLVDEDDVESDINDFSDDEIKQEFLFRNLGVIENDIMKEDLDNRFSNILKKCNPIEIDKLLSDLELKYNVL